MTLNLVKGRLWKVGACTKPVPLGQATRTSTTCPSGTGTLGQAVLVPVGQARCLYQTCPTGTGKGQKRPVDRSYTHAGFLSLSQDKPYAHDGTCPSPLCPNLSHKVGLQGRGKVFWLHVCTANWFLHLNLHFGGVLYSPVVYEDSFYFITTRWAYHAKISS